MAYARDLKSLDAKASCRFESGPGHQLSAFCSSTCVPELCDLPPKAFPALASSVCWSVYSAESFAEAVFAEPRVARDVNRAAIAAVLRAPDTFRLSDQLLDVRLLMIGRGVRIALRRNNRSVTEQFLDTPEIDASHNKPRSERVTQIVPAEIVDAGFSTGLSEPGSPVGLIFCTAVWTNELPSVRHRVQPQNRLARG
jgi:hypothetical protein